LCHGNSFIPISLKTTFRGTRCLGALVTPRVERPSFVSWRAQDSTTTSNGDVEETRETMQSSSMDSSTEGNTLLGDSSSLTPQESPANTSSEEELEPRPYYKLYMEQKQLEKQFQRHERDTGSSEVQIARLTARINHLTEHAKKHKHDYAAIRGLIGLVNQRKRLLKYLRRYGDDRVIELAKKLHIRVSRELVESRK